MLLHNCIQTVQSSLGTCPLVMGVTFTHNCIEAKQFGCTTCPYLLLFPGVLLDYSSVTILLRQSPMISLSRPKEVLTAKNLPANDDLACVLQEK